MMNILISLIERGLFPDVLIRLGIRRLLRKRLQHERKKSERHNGSRSFIVSELRQGLVAIQTDKPKEQHYELPPSFFHHILGKQMKYSCNYWSEYAMTLDESEATMLEIICKRADIHDEMDILDLGCGYCQVERGLKRSQDDRYTHQGEGMDPSLGPGEKLL